MKVVTPTEETPIGARIRALAERAIADGAITCLVVWEDKAGALTYDSAPDSPSLVAGMLAELRKLVDPDGWEDID